MTRFPPHRTTHRETTWIICGSTSKKPRSRAGNGVERRGGDSNPRCSYPHTRFPSVPDRPLRHLSNQGVMLCRPQRSAPIHYYRASLQPRKRGRRPKREDVAQRLRAAGHAGGCRHRAAPGLEGRSHPAGRLRPGTERRQPRLLRRLQPGVLTSWHPVPRRLSSSAPQARSPVSERASRVGLTRTARGSSSGPTPGGARRPWV